MSKRKKRRMITPTSSNPNQQGYVICQNGGRLDFEAYAGKQHVQLSVPLETALDMVAALTYTVAQVAKSNGMEVHEYMLSVRDRMDKIASDDGVWDVLHDNEPANS